MTKEIIAPDFRAYIAGTDLYRRTAESALAQFEGNELALRTIGGWIDVEKGAGSQFFFNTQAALYLPKGSRVATFKDLERINDHDNSFLQGTCTYTSDLVLRSEEAVIPPLASTIELIANQARRNGFNFSPSNPLVLSGFTLEGDTDPGNLYGLRIRLADNVSAYNDSRFSYEEGVFEKEIPFGKTTKKILNEEHGFSAIYLGIRGDIDTGISVLPLSDPTQRIVIFEDRSFALN